MDGFDDLLSSSSRALEANPFANPFAQPRSSSPDPWASFGQPEAQDDSSSNATGYSSNFGHTLDSNFDSYTGDEKDKAEEEYLQHKDASSQELEASTQQTPDVDSTPPSTSPIHSSASRQFPLSPGFRESISNEDVSSENAKDDMVEHNGSPQSLDHSAEDVFSVKEQAPQAERTVSPPIPSASPGVTHPTFTAQSTAFSSPLDSVFSANIDKPFASLALGGESVGGWQDEDARVATSSTAAMVPQKGDEHSPESPLPAPQGPIPTFVISVDDPQKVGDAIRPYILYTVRTKTSSPLFTKSTCSVLRRYSDFLWLYETLSLNNPGVVVPPVPEKSSFGRFESHFIQQRRMALEKCIQKIANHPVLAKDLDLKFFLESDSFALDIKHRKLEIAQDRGGIMSSIGQSITGAKFYEVDDWFDKKKTYLDSLEIQLKALFEWRSTSNVDLAVATGEFAVGISELSGSDLSAELSHSLTALANVEKQLQDIHNIQAEDDINTLLTDEYARLINSVRMAFVSRIRCHTQWQNAESEARRVKQAHEKGRNSGKIPQDRISHSLNQVADAERRSNECKHEFDKCSKLIKMEFARFEEERINDFKTSLEDLLEGMIRRQKETIVVWEKYQEMLLSKVQAKHRGTRSSIEAHA
ncbi:Vps5-domain-containing protein [Schizopora paradoxa]|uniref:Vps5-domain-containing protein n=1 Tax=Schizopora paradoxa TaxID=27342 RepID=A0A0H2RTC7_9AGAM|nr:Vps5-domain-containing protein [Schizopora paradoxa]